MRASSHNAAAKARPRARAQTSDDETRARCSDCADGHRRKGDGKVFKAEHGSTYFVSIYETRD